MFKCTTYSNVTAVENFIDRFPKLMLRGGVRGGEGRFVLNLTTQTSNKHMCLIKQQFLISTITFCRSWYRSHPCDSRHLETWLGVFVRCGGERHPSGNGYDKNESSLLNGKRREALRSVAECDWRNALGGRTLKVSGWMNEEERPWQVISQKIFVINDFAYLSCASRHPRSSS